MVLPVNRPAACTCKAQLRFWQLLQHEGPEH